MARPRSSDLLEDCITKRLQVPGLLRTSIRTSVANVLLMVAACCLRTTSNAGGMYLSAPPGCQIIYLADLEEVTLSMRSVTIDSPGTSIIQYCPSIARAPGKLDPLGEINWCVGVCSAPRSRFLDPLCSHPTVKSLVAFGLLLIGRYFYHLSGMHKDPWDYRREGCQCSRHCRWWSQFPAHSAQRNMLGEVWVPRWWWG